MKKNGFTLIELTGAIVLLSLIVLVAFPAIVNVVKRSDNKINAAVEALIIDGAKNFIDDNKNEYTLTNGNVDCITIQDLIEKGYVISDLESVNGKVDTAKFVKVTVNNNKYEYEITDTCSPKK